MTDIAPRRYRKSWVDQRALAHGVDDALTLGPVRRFLGWLFRWK